MRRLHSALVPILVVLALGLAGCKKVPQPPEPDAGAVSVVPAPPVVPPQLRVTLSAESPELGTFLIAFDEERLPEIPQAQELRVRTNLALTNYRVRVMDEADRALASDDAPEDAPVGTLYRIVLAEPLKTGFRYALVLDAQTGHELLDADGRSHPEVRLDFKVAGEREKPPPPPKKKRGKRR